MLYLGRQEEGSTRNHPPFGIECVYEVGGFWQGRTKTVKRKQRCQVQSQSPNSGWKTSISRLKSPNAGPLTLYNHFFSLLCSDELSIHTKVRGRDSTVGIWHPLAEPPCPRPASRGVFLCISRFSIIGKKSLNAGRQRSVPSMQDGLVEKQQRGKQLSLDCQSAGMILMQTGGWYL